MEVVIRDFGFEMEIPESALDAFDELKGLLGERHEDDLGRVLQEAIRQIGDMQEELDAVNREVAALEEEVTLLQAELADLS